MNTALLSQGLMSMIVATTLNAQKNQRFSSKNNVNCLLI